MPQNPEVDDIASSVAAAYSALEADDPMAEGHGLATDEPPAAEEPEAKADEPAATEEPKPTREGRDEKGRFAPKAPPASKQPAKGAGAPPPAGEATAAGGPPTPPAPAAGPVSPEAQPALQTRAPASWKPAEREAWGSVPVAAQEAIQRREREVAVALQQAAEARKTAQAFTEAYRPFEGLIRAEGLDPVRAVSTLLQTHATLRQAPPAMRAQTMAQIIKQYDVPIDALDAALAGQAPPQGATQQPAQYRDPRLDQLLAHIQQTTQTRQQEHAARAAAEIEQFKAQAEFLDEVREDMADLIEAAAKRGRELSMPDAYKIATQAHPEISKVLAQREAARVAGTAQAATQRARAAASSVRSTPAPAAKPPPPKTGRDDIMADVADAWDRLEQ